MTALTTDDIKCLYQKRAKHYDITANLYYLLGFREWSYRKQAITALALNAGDTVVEIGCGTGLNFSLLQAAVGPTGKIIGVDLTEAMLAQAQKRVEKKGWSNVELVQSDASLFRFPADVGGIVSTFALSLMKNMDKIILNGCQALTQGKRWVILDLKLPSNWFSKFWPLFLPITRPFGITVELVEQRPWELILQKFKQSLNKVYIKELYMGFTYIAAGEAK